MRGGRAEPIARALVGGVNVSSRIHQPGHADCGEFERERIGMRVAAANKRAVRPAIEYYIARLALPPVADEEIAAVFERHDQFSRWGGGQAVVGGQTMRP